VVFRFSHVQVSLLDVFGTLFKARIIFVLGFEERLALIETLHIASRASPNTGNERANLSVAILGI
jgi:hypothetical protein